MGNVLPGEINTDNNNTGSNNNNIITSSTIVDNNGNHQQSNSNRFSKWNDEYFIVNNQIIGHGAFGKVWIIKSKRNLNQYYAMKEINLDRHIFRIKRKNLSYALEEGKKMQQLNHRNIVSYLTTYNDDTEKKTYLIMEYCNGGSLRDRITFQLNKRSHTGGRCVYFNENLIWYWTIQILNGIKYIHSKDIIHRDLKPDNVFIDSRTGECKLGDFGLAKMLEDNFNSNVSEVGTPIYMPPELHELRRAQQEHMSADRIDTQAGICRSYNKKGDIFSFGCILFELARLKPAITDFINGINYNIDIDKTTYSNDLKTFIVKTLQKDPSCRPDISTLADCDIVRTKLNFDFSIYYKEQMIPCIDLEKSLAPSIERSNFLQLRLQSEYKPSSMVILRLNHNLIIIAVNKYMNKVKRSTSIFKSLTSMFLSSESASNANANQNYNLSTINSIEPQYEIDYRETSDSVEESKLLIYSEFGELLCEFDYYIENSMKKKMQFEILSMCTDEEQSHLYVSTSMRKIMRFKYSENVLDLVFDGILDLDGLDSIRGFEPAALHILDTPQSSSPNNAKNQNQPQQQNRILLLSDRGNKRLTAIRITTIRTGDDKIKCETKWGVTVDQTYHVTQITSTKTEILCLLSDFETIQVYDAQTQVAKRNNKNAYKKLGVMIRTNCICHDSDFNIYATNGHSLHAFDLNSFRLYQKYKPVKPYEDNPDASKDLFDSLMYMQILNNGKLVLLKDAVQTDNAELFIIKPSI